MKSLGDVTLGQGGLEKTRGPDTPSYPIFIRTWFLSRNKIGIIDLEKQTYMQEKTKRPFYSNM